MNLKEWRKLKGYSLKQVAVMLDKTSPSTIHYMEQNGVKSDRVRTDIKRVSLGKVTNFDGCVGN